jgi:hypothetical protein
MECFYDHDAVLGPVTLTVADDECRQRVALLDMQELPS